MAIHETITYKRNDQFLCNDMEKILKVYQVRKDLGAGC